MQRELLSLDPNMLSLDFNVLSLAFDEVVFQRLFMRGRKLNITGTDLDYNLFSQQKGHSVEYVFPGLID